MAKRLLFSGYFGFGNAGDEAIIEALCQEVRRQDSEAEISVLLDNEEFARYLGVTSYARKKPQAIIQALRNCDLLISGGGGLLQDSTGAGSVIYYLGIIALARLLLRPTFVMCQGFGPIRQGLSKGLVKALLPLVREATWRDEESVQEVRQLAPRVKSRLSADPALLLEPLDVEQIKLDNGLQRPYIVVAMRNWPGLSVDSVAHTLSSWLESNIDKDVAIIPFQESQDSELAAELARLLEKFGERIHLVKGLRPRQVLGIIKDAEAVLAMRLHALIFAASQGVPGLGLAYDPKVARFCERARIPYIPWDELEESSLGQKWNEVWQNMSELRTAIGAAVEPMRGAAREAVASALRLLN